MLQRSGVGVSTRPLCPRPQFVSRRPWMNLVGKLAVVNFQDMLFVRHNAARLSDYQRMRDQPNFEIDMLT